MGWVATAVKAIGTAVAGSTAAGSATAGWATIGTTVATAAASSAIANKLTPKPKLQQASTAPVGAPKNILAGAPAAPAAVHQVGQDVRQAQAKRRGIKSTILAGETGGYSNKTILQRLG